MVEQQLTAESAYTLLQASPSVRLARRTGMPPNEGLYAVWANGSLVYVGISGNLEKRWYTHECIDKIFSEYEEAFISWVVMDFDEARKIERELIRMFRPRFNKAINPDWVPEFLDGKENSEVDIIGTGTMINIYRVSRRFEAVEIDDDNEDLIGVMEASRLSGQLPSTISRLMTNFELPEYRKAPSFDDGTQRFTSRAATMSLQKRRPGKRARRGIPAALE